MAVTGARSLSDMAVRDTAKINIGIGQAPRGSPSVPVVDGLILEWKRVVTIWLKESSVAGWKKSVRKG